MFVYLTESELAREEHIFEAREEVYSLKKGAPFDIRTFRDETPQDKDMISIPAS